MSQADTKHQAQRVKRRFVQGLTLTAVLSIPLITAGQQANVSAHAAQYAVRESTAACVRPPAGLVSWWPGDARGKDIWGHNNGTFFQGATTASGLIGQAFDLNGAGARVLIPDSASLALTHSLSIEAWFNARAYTPANGGQSQIFFRGDDRPNLDPYTLDVLGNGHIEFTISSLSDIAKLDAPVPLTQWTFVVATLDDVTGIMSLYVNGGPVAQTTTSVRPLEQLLANEIPGLAIGDVQSTNYQEAFNGLINEVSVYNRALTGTEVMALYNAGAAGKCRSFSAPAHPTATFSVTVPSANTTLTGSVLPFLWNDFPKAAYYDLQVWLVHAIPAQSLSPTAVTIFSKRLMGTSYRLDVRAMPKGIYRWRMAPTDTSGTLLAPWTPEQVVTLQ